MKKREWCYVLQPYYFDILCDQCQGTNITWSEYEHKIWCYNCCIDTEGTGGIFTGPIPIEVVYMTGIHFDRLLLESNIIQLFNKEIGDWIYIEYVKREFEDVEFIKDSLINQKRINSLKNKFGHNIFSRLKQYTKAQHNAEI